MRRVIVCGGREYDDRETMASVLYKALDVRATNRTVVVHGAARGADTLAASIAEGWGLRTEPHGAKWRCPDGSIDKGAGFKRNEEMAQLGADLCIAFPGGNGTAHMIRCARGHGIPVQVVKLSVWHLLDSDHDVVASVEALDAPEARRTLRWFGLEGAWLRKAS